MNYDTIKQDFVKLFASIAEGTRAGEVVVFELEQIDAVVDNLFAVAANFGLTFSIARDDAGLLTISVVNLEE